MVIAYGCNLKESLKIIGYLGNSHKLEVHSKEHLAEHSHELINKYGDAKWAVIDLLNQNFNKVLKDKFDLYNWLNHNENDEVAYFINEVGSNSLNYSEFKAPHKFHLFLGKCGFIIGIEQKGKGFDATKVDKQGIKENEGAGFNFFRNCKSIIFFDNPNDTKIVYLCYKI